jgi:hypothetical protein
MRFDWDPSKNDKLKAERGVSFEQVVGAIGTEDDLGVIQNPARPGQFIIVVKIGGYTYCCPAVPDDDGFFLKTIYPSRKLHKRYGGE